MKLPTQSELNQCRSLRDSIIRLCNEADNSSIVVSSLFNSLVDYSQKMDMRPCDIAWTIIDCIAKLTNDDPVSLLVHLLMGHANSENHKGH